MTNFKQKLIFHRKISEHVRFNFALYLVARYLSLCDAFFVSRRPVNNLKIRLHNISNHLSSSFLLLLLSLIFIFQKKGNFHSGLPAKCTLLFIFPLLHKLVTEKRQFHKHLNPDEVSDHVYKLTEKHLILF